MEYSNNRGGCMQRPQLPEPPHTNTGSSCGCAVQRPMQPDMPIAMAYVPMQRWNQVYDMSRGLTRGTIFPELQKPFCGRGGAWK